MVENFGMILNPEKLSTVPCISKMHFTGAWRHSLRILLYAFVHSRRLLDPAFEQAQTVAI